MTQTLFILNPFFHVQKVIKATVQKQREISYKSYLKFILLDLLFVFVSLLGCYIAYYHDSAIGLTYLSWSFCLALSLLCFAIMFVIYKWTQSIIDDIKNRT